MPIFASDGSDKGFKAGDIIEGYEGDGRTWGTTTTMLLLYIGKSDVCALVLHRKYTVPDKDRPRSEADFGRWTLQCRDWKKVGEVPELAAAAPAVADAVASWEAKK